MSCRFLAGIEEQGLGDGWSKLVLAYPAYRTFTEKATVELDMPGDGALVLQIHAGHLEFGAAPPRLGVRVADRVSTVLVGAGWNTFHVPLAPSAGRHAVELTLIPGGGWCGKLMVNEVSLLQEHSPLLVHYTRRLNLTSVEMPKISPSLPAAGEALGAAPWYLLTERQDRVYVRARVRGRGIVRLMVEGEVTAEATLRGVWQWVAGELPAPPQIIAVGVEGDEMDVSRVEVLPGEAEDAGSPQKPGERL
jgi:hypothetical protein